MEQIVIPSLLVNNLTSGTAINMSNEQLYVASENKLMGGFRVLMQRGQEFDCIHPSDAYSCYTDVFDDTTSNNIYQSKSQISDYIWKSAVDNDEDTLYQGQLGFYDGSGYSVLFPPNEQESLLLLDRLKTNNFFDVSTRLVTIDFVTYNPTLDLHTISRISFEISSAGGVEKRMDIKTWRLNRYRGNKTAILIALEIAFALCILYFTIEEFIEMRYGCNEYIKDIWNYVDWVSLILFYILIINHVISYTMFEHDTDNLFNPDKFVNLRVYQAMLHWETYLEILNGYLLFIKVFKYLTFSQRVRFLYDIFNKSSRDILIFAFVLFVFFVGFGMAGFLAFGSDVSDFRTLTMSILNLTRFTITDMNFAALVASNRFLGSSYFVIWSILILLILTNVFIAILSNAYSSVSAQYNKEPKLPKINLGIKQKLAKARDSVLNPLNFLVKGKSTDHDSKQKHSFTNTTTDTKSSYHQTDTLDTHRRNKLKKTRRKAASVIKKPRRHSFHQTTDKLNKSRKQSMPLVLPLQHQTVNKKINPQAKSSFQLQPNKHIEKRHSSATITNEINLHLPRDNNRRLYDSLTSSQQRNSSRLRDLAQTISNTIDQLESLNPSQNLAIAIQQDEINHINDMVKHSQKLGKHTGTHTKSRNHNKNAHEFKHSKNETDKLDVVLPGNVNDSGSKDEAYHHHHHSNDTATQTQSDDNILVRQKTIRLEPKAMARKKGVGLAASDGPVFSTMQTNGSRSQHVSRVQLAEDINARLNALENRLLSLLEAASLAQQKSAQNNQSDANDLSHRKKKR